MQTRGTYWFDKDAMKEKFGIKVKDPKRGWLNAGENGNLFMFDTLQERETKRAELRKIKLPG